MIPPGIFSCVCFSTSLPIYISFQSLMHLNFNAFQTNGRCMHMSLFFFLKQVSTISVSSMWVKFVLPFLLSAWASPMGWNRICQVEGRVRKQGLPDSGNSLCKGVPHWNTGPSEASRSYSVPSNGHFKCLVQILFRGEGEDEASGKGKEGRVLDGKVLPVFHFLDNSALPQTCKPHSAKQTPCIG